MTQKLVPETISYLLKQTCRAHRNTAHKLLAEIGLHPGQEMILFRLWQADGLTQSELVEKLCVQPATVTKMLNRMVKNGLVDGETVHIDATLIRADVSWESLTVKHADKVLEENREEEKNNDDKSSN